jgi:hypothetical protein
MEIGNADTKRRQYETIGNKIRRDGTYNDKEHKPNKHETKTVMSQNEPKK